MNAVVYSGPDIPGRHDVGTTITTSAHRTGTVLLSVGAIGLTTMFHLDVEGATALARQLNAAVAAIDALQVAA